MENRPGIVRFGVKSSQLVSGIWGFKWLMTDTAFAPFHKTLLNSAAENCIISTSFLYQWKFINMKTLTNLRLHFSIFLFLDPSLFFDYHCLRTACDIASEFWGNWFCHFFPHVSFCNTAYIYIGIVYLPIVGVPFRYWLGLQYILLCRHCSYVRITTARALSHYCDVTLSQEF